MFKERTLSMEVETTIKLAPRFIIGVIGIYLLCLRLRRQVDFTRSTDFKFLT
ncbi:unnamed protein product [Hymenolepis diminuta]|uniref:Uncharacterized protein n=1 Tax=Hymenolepis diminuta TaxID=6216 RepID=A0A564Z001_HYMDI|nr:unnamed protein product [Hymenolepis diminuta]